MPIVFQERAPTAGEPGSEAPRRASAGAILGTALRAWARNVVPLTAVAIAVELPVLGVELASRQPFALATPGDKLIQCAAWLLAATVSGSAALRAVRGEPVRLLAALAALRHAPRVLAAHLVAYGTVVAGTVALLASAAVRTGGPRSEPVLAACVGLLLLACAVLRTLHFPLTAAVLDEQALGPWAVARRARALSAGRRRALLAVVLVPLAATAGNVLQAIVTIDEPAPGPGWIVGRRAVVALASGLLELLPAAAYVVLRREQEDRSLERVFE